MNRLLLLYVLIVSCSQSDVLQNEGINGSQIETNKYVVLDSVRFSDGTDLQILIKALDDEEKCHSCDVPVKLKRSSFLSNGKKVWVQSSVSVHNQWGEPGRFYLDKLKAYPDLLFYRGGYSQFGTRYEWINAFRTDVQYLGEKEWSFQFKSSYEEHLDFGNDSLLELTGIELLDNSPVDIMRVMRGEMDFEVNNDLLNIFVEESQELLVYLDKDDSLLKLNQGYKYKEIFYHLENGNVYLDSAYSQNTRNEISDKSL